MKISFPTEKEIEKSDMNNLLRQAKRQIFGGREGQYRILYKEIYNKYWFDYDEKYKQNILDKIDEELSSVEDQMKRSRFLKKWFIKNVTYRVLKDIRIIIEKWYTPGKMIVNWKTVSIWDLVDIYIDPNDNTIYHVDIDFLMRK